MNSNSNTVSLSARQKANFHFGNYFWMLLLLLVLLLASVVNTSGQSKQLKKVLPKGNEPIVDIKINRHYDNKGNVIGYDSTYSSYYSSAPGDTIWMHKVMKDFNRHFDDSRISFFERHFDRPFLEDTIIMTPHSFNKDFFGHEFFLGPDSWHKFLDDMTHRLDSLRNGFFHEDHKRRYKL